MDIQEYRKAIVDTLMARKNSKGTAFMTETEAEALLQELTDEELEEGIDFNTPEDMADLLIEIGRL